MAVAAGAIVPGKQPNGRLPPRTPGDEEKIARRLGQASSTKGNGKIDKTKTIIANFMFAGNNTKFCSLCDTLAGHAKIL